MVKSSATTTVTTNRATAKQHEGAGRMMAAALVMLMMSLAGGLLAQGALTLSSHTATTFNTSSSIGGSTVEIVNTGTVPIKIYRVSAIPAATGVITTEIRTRIGGAFSVYPPVNSGSFLNTGWVINGTASVNYTSTTVPVQVPVDLNIVLAPSASLGITANFATVSPRFASPVAAPGTVTNANLTIRFSGSAGVASTTVGSSGHAASFTPYAVPMGIFYDVPVATGNHCSVVNGSVTLNNPIPAIGSNLVRASIENIGLSALDNVVLPMDYSTNGGLTWSPIQNFSFPTFPAFAVQQIEFTATPWLISAPGTYDVRVRFNPAVGTGNQQAARIFGRDADVTSVSLSPQSAQIGIPVDVQATITNNGDFSLESVPLNLRYSLDGTNWVPQTFTPGVGQLASKGSTQTFTFAQQLTVPTPGNYTLRADFSAQVAGDPDTTDVITRALNNFGSTDINVTTPVLAGSASTTTVPYNYNVSRALATWTPDQLGYIAGEISGMSLWAISGAQTIGREFQNVKIWLGETTRIAGTHSTTFLANFDVPSRPQTLVYDGPITYVAGPNLGYLWDNVKFTSTFDYSGLNNLAVYCEYTAAAFAPSYSRIFYTDAGNRNFHLYTGNTTHSTLSTIGTYTGNIAHAIRIQYEPNLLGSHVKVVSIGTAANASIVSGNNSVAVTVKNVGNVDLSASPINLEYSLNGGSTWVPFTIPPSTFGPGQKITATLTTTWNVTAIGPTDVMARLVAPTPIAPLHGPVTKTFRPDADVATATLMPTAPRIGVPTDVRVTVRNNGDFSLEGVPLSLRYTMDGGTWVPQVFTPAVGQLATRGSTQEFTFTQQYTLTMAGNYNLKVEFLAQVVGDPDTLASDSFTRPLPSFGVTDVVVTAPLLLGTVTGITTGFNTLNGGVMMTWAPEDLGYINGEITEMSLWELNSGFTGTKTWTNVKIWLGETTSSAGVAPTNYSTTFLTNFNAPVAGQVLVYDGTPAPMTNGAAGQFVFNNLQFSTPFIYSGVNRLCLYMQYTSTATTPSMTIRYYQGSGRNNFKLYSTTAANTVGTYAGNDIAHTARIKYQAIYPGSNVAIVSAGLANNALMNLGNNTAEVTIQNVGTTNLSSTVVAVEYSTDGGTVWTPVTIPVPAFNSMQKVTHPLTTTWSQAAVNAASLRVRLIAPTPIAPVGSEVTRSYVPDVDVEALTTNPTTVLYNTPFTVGLTARNNGGWNLSTATVVFYYSVGAGTPTSQPFLLSSLTTANSTQVLSFPTSGLIVQRGTQVLTAGISPQLGGDPDSQDKTTIVLPDIGLTVGDTPVGTVTGAGTPIYGLTTTGYDSVNVSIYTPADLPATLVANSEIKSLKYYKNLVGGTDPSVTNAFLRVWLLNTTSDTFAAAPTFAQVIAGATQMTDITGFSIPVQTVGWVEIGPFNLNTPFVYTGGNLQVVTQYSVQPATSPYHTATLSFRRRLIPTTPARVPGAIALQTTPVLPTSILNFQVSANTHLADMQVGFVPPSVTDLDVAGVSFNNPASARPIVGSNAINVTVRSMGTGGFTGSYDLRYSLDGGTSWSPHQTFAASGLTGINTSQEVTFTAPWNIATLGVQSIAVQLNPVVTGDPDVVDIAYFSYRPDLDVMAVDFVAPPVLGMPSVVKATIKSVGTLRFPQSFTLPLRYRINTGPWVSQVFTATGLSTENGEETFTFSQDYMFMVAGSHDVTVEIDPSFPGDPDSTDSLTKNFPLIGVPSLTLSNYPGIIPSGSMGSTGSGMSFEVQCGPSGPVTINYVSMPASLEGTWTVRVSTRLGGAHVNYPPASTTDLITTGWTNYPPTTLTFTAAQVLSPFTLVRVPVFLGVTLQPNQILGIAISHNCNTWRYFGTQATTPVAVTNSDLSIRYAGYAGGASAVLGGPMHSAAFSRQMVTEVDYSIPPQAGTHIGLNSVAVNSGTGIVIGQNTIRSVVQNFGADSYDAQPVVAEYSINGGSTWVGTQTFTYPSFPSRSIQFANFTMPWTISTQVAQELRVRLIPPTTIGSANASITSTFTPDADITAISLNPVTPLPGVPNNVRATVTNNGGFNLTGQSMQLQYRVTLGTGAPGQWFTQAFPATDLSQGRSMTFEFTTNPLTFFTEGPYTIEVGFATQVAGDTDTNDTFSRVYTDIGLTVATLATQALGAPNTAGNNFPMNWVTGGWFSSWSPTQMGNATGYISQFGLQYFSAFTAKTYGNVKIWVGETSNTTTTANTDFMANFNAGNPAVLAYDSALTISNPIADGFARIQLQNGYIYSGLNNIGVYIQITGGSGAPSSTVRTYPAGPANIRVYNDTAVGPIGIVNNVATGAVFVFETVYNPGLVVERVGGGRVQPQGNDGLGISVTAANPSVVNYLLKNRSQTTNLTISNISVSNPINCVASISGTSPTTVAFGGVGVPLAFNLTAGPGAYSFDVTIVSNNAQPGANPFVFTVSGTGFVNTAPAIAPVSASSRTLLITEVSSDPPPSLNEFIEITNVSSAPVSITGWVIVAYDSGGGATNANAPQIGYPYTIVGPPGGGILNPGATWVVSDSQSTAPGNEAMSGNIFWNTGNSGGVMLISPSQLIADFMCFGPTSLPTTITAPQPVGANWIGAPVAFTAIQGMSMRRIGVLDNDDAADWVQSAAISLQTANTEMTLPFGGGETQVSGTHPNYVLETVVGANLATVLLAGDTDTFQNLSIVVSEAVIPGSLTPTAAGFTTIFPYTTTPGLPPHGAVLLGTALAPGTVKFTATVTDNGVFPLFSTINIEFRIGARVDVNTMDADSMFVRVNGRKDFYRGQTNQPVELTITSNNPMPVHLSALNFALKEKVSGDPVTGVTFTLPSNPVIIPANATNHPVTVSMDIGATASGANGVACELLLSSGTAFNPLAPTDVFVVKIAPAGQVDEFDLYDGPVPQPMVITLAAFNPAVISVGFTQNLTVSGGSGSYTWSVDPSSASQLPDGLVVNPTGSQFLPATISGTPTALATIGNYVITLRVTDGAYVDTKTLTMTVAALTPLVFTPITLAPGMEYVPYTMTTPFSASGGSLIYTYSVDAGSTDQLPLGLSLNAQTGVISGTPAGGTQNAYTITFALDDGLSTLNQTLTLTITPNVLQWRSTTLPTATQTVAYNEALDAIGGTGPRIYSIVSGTLPNGLSLTAATGVISGVPSLTPPSAGSYNLVFKVTDGVNANVNQAITITVVPAAPLVVTTANLLDYAEVGQPYSTSIISTGGSQSYTFTVSNSGPALPAGLTLAPSGDLTGTPGIGTDGRYDIVISVNDGFQTIAKTLTLAVLAQSANSFGISEVDTGTGYIELANDSTNVIDVSGWSLRVWVDGNSPINLPFDSVPGASLALPGEVVMITIGGTAGGFWPTYSTGGSWTASGTSNIAVQLLDIFGNTVDFAAFGTVNRSALQDGANNAIELPGDLGTDPNSSNGSANYSFTGNGWTGAATGTPGVLNAGTQAFPLAILKDEIRTAVAGESFFDFTLAIGGTKPYTYSLVAPGATWLSLGATSGVFSGTVPAVTSVTTVNIDVTVTDANTVAVTETFTLNLAPATHAASGTFTVANAEGQSFEGTVIDVPVTFTRANGVTDVSGFAFIIDLPTTTAAELDVVRVIAGPAAMAAGRGIVARDMGNNRLFIGDTDGLGNATPLGDGVVAIIRFVVPMDDSVMAPEATYGVTISNIAITRDTPGVYTAAGVSGSMILSNYKPQDVNRDNAIDVVDVQFTVNLILALQSPTYAGQGDANQDNAVDVVDVQTIVNCILLGGC